MDFSSRFLLAATVAAALATLSVAEAADKPIPDASAPKSKDAILSQAQLRECLSQKDKLDQRNGAVLKAKSDIDAATAELDRTAADIAAMQATLDRTKKEDIDAYNAKVVARNALVENFQARATSYNQDVEAAQASQRAYSSTCGNRRYDDRDLADIQRSKK